MHLPIPLYWFVVHPNVEFWRRHEKSSYWVGLMLSWVPVTLLLLAYRAALFRRDWPPPWRISAGLFLIFLDGWIFGRVRRDLGAARLVGKTELSGGGEIVSTGIYSRIRHPRYLGSFAAILGACLIAGTRALWVVVIAWAALTRIAIAFEERELRARFGKPYDDYCRRVPRFIPLSLRPRAG